MKHSKQHYRDKAYNGYTWGGWLHGDKHFFTKPVRDALGRTTGYLELICTETDLVDGNYEYMVDNGLTRSKK